MCLKRSTKKSKMGFRIDPCMEQEVELLRKSGIKTVACCCGHNKYPKTIIINENGTYREYFSGITIPRKKYFYLSDNDGVYYLPESITGGNPFGLPKLSSTEYLQKNPEKRKQFSKAQYQRVKQRCLIDPEFKAKVKKSKLICRKRKWQRIRKEIIELIKQVGKCDNCGFNDVRALQIHHLDRTEKKGMGMTDAQNIRKGKVKYTIICANCHAIIHNVRGINNE